MTLLALVERLLGGESGAVVGDFEQEASPTALDPHDDLGRVGVRVHVAQRLPRGPQHEQLVQRGKPFRRQDDLDLDTLLLEIRDERSERFAEPARRHFDRVDAGQKAPQAADGASGVRSGLAQGRVEWRLGLDGRPLNRVRDCQEILHCTVVDLGGDAPPLGVRDLDDALEQALAVPAVPGDPEAEQDRDRDLDQA